MRVYMGVRNQRPAWPYVVAGALLLPIYAAVVSFAWIKVATQARCSSIAHDATPTLYVGVFGMLWVAAAYVVLARNENEPSWSRLATYFFLWNALLGAVQVWFSIFYQTYAAVQWDLRRWGSSHIPVFVGEFGTVVGDTSERWGWLMAFVGDMHYAYWPLNGCRPAATQLRGACPSGPAAYLMSSYLRESCSAQQHQPHFHKHFKGSSQFQMLENDTFGILDCDWATVRDVNWTNTIFAK